MTSASPAISETTPAARAAPEPTPVFAAAPEPTWPDPPRYWWLKRLSLASLLLLLSLALVRVAWGWESHRRLARELAPVRAAGDPVSAAETNVAPVPDAENGALVYRRAFAAIRSDSPSSSTLSYSDHLPLPPRWHKMEDESIRTNGEMLSAVREARAYSRFDWKVRIGWPGYVMVRRELSRSHHVSNLLHDAALHAHVHGDDVEAIERTRDARHLAAALDAPPASFQAHLLGVYSIEGGALYRLQIITPSLTVAPAGDDDAAGHIPLPIPSNPAVRPAARPAMRSQVRALIAELLDEREPLDGLRRAFAGERAIQFDVAESFATGAWLLRPMFEIDAARVARARAALAAGAAAPDWPAAKSALAHEPLLWRTPQTNLGTTMGTSKPTRPAMNSPIDYTQILSSDVCSTPAADRAISYDLNARADRRLSAAALAVRLYRVDHADQFPPSLEALVPAYLPFVPSDPFVTNGAPIRYVILPGALPDGRDRPLVYSVGSDGRDDTALRGAATVPKTPCFGIMKGPDKWVDLVGWAPPLTPEEQAAEAAAEEAVRFYDNEGRRIPNDAAK
jgi:hypothetical protein